VEQLGKYLRQRRILTDRQLEDGLQLQVIFGVRLGTSLVECGHLSLEDLARHLAAQTGLPAAPLPWLEMPEPAARSALPVAAVRRHQALPLRLADGALHVAVLDAEHAARVAGAIKGRRIKPYVVPELRLSYWLERHYGIRRRVRYVDIGSHDASRPSKPAKRAKPPAPHRPEPPRTHPALEALGFRALEADEELIDEPTYARLFPWLGFAARDPAAPAPSDPADPHAAAQLEEELAAAPDRETMLRIAFQLAACYARAVGLFVVHRGLIQGCRGLGSGIDERIRGLIVSTDVESALGAVAQTGKAYRGDLRGHHVGARLLEALGRSDAPEVAIFPLRIGRRTVNLLYADNAPDGLGTTCFGALAALCESVSLAYANLLQEKKDEITRT
jgi:hypothetical protein